MVRMTIPIVELMTVPCWIQLLFVITSWLTHGTQLHGRIPNHLCPEKLPDQVRWEGDWNPLDLHIVPVLLILL